MRRRGPAAQGALARWNLSTIYRCPRMNATFGATLENGISDMRQVRVYPASSCLYVSACVFFLSARHHRQELASRGPAHPGYPLRGPRVPSPRVALSRTAPRDLERACVCLLASDRTNPKSRDDIQVMSSDLNVESIGALIPPSCVFEELPADLAVYEHVVARRHLQILPRLDCRDC